jgi:hypothetical protein
MAHEITAWKRPNCSLFLKTDRVSAREIFSREINEEFGEGGGLNANYKTVEAVATVANILGKSGLVYGEDFVFKTGGETISFDFKDPKTLAKALIVLGVSGLENAFLFGN